MSSGVRSRSGRSVKMRRGGGQASGSSGRQSSNNGHGVGKRSFGAERHGNEHGGDEADVERRRRRRRRQSPSPCWGARRRKVQGPVGYCSPSATCSLCGSLRPCLPALKPPDAASVSRARSDVATQRRQSFGASKRQSFGVRGRRSYAEWKRRSGGHWGYNVGSVSSAIASSPCCLPGDLAWGG